MDKNDVIYHIFIDRFAGFGTEADDTKPVWIGGNLRSIKTKLNYFHDLGVTWILLSPLYKGSAYHGYSITDFYKVDEHFGTETDLGDLVEIIHSTGMKIMMDYVPNHCSHLHPFFLEAKKDKESIYQNWFTFNKWPTDYDCFLDFKSLPKLNLENKETRKYIIKNAIYWLKKFNIDGFRLDHVIGPSHDFWREFSQQIKEAKKETILLGEVWFRGIKFKHLSTLKGCGIFARYLWNKFLLRNPEDAPMTDRTMMSYVGIFDGCLDFTFNKLVREYTTKSRFSKNRFWRKLRAHYEKFPENFLLPTFLDNHDMNRFLFEAGGDKNKLISAVKLQLEINQPKIIYYGTEVGLTQETGVNDWKQNGDIMARKKMVWEDKKQDQELLKFYREIFYSRKS